MRAEPFAAVLDRLADIAQRLSRSASSPGTPFRIPGGRGERLSRDASLGLVERDALLAEGAAGQATQRPHGGGGASGSSTSSARRQALSTARPRHRRAAKSNCSLRRLLADPKTATTTFSEEVYKGDVIASASCRRSGLRASARTVEFESIMGTHQQRCERLKRSSRTSRPGCSQTRSPSASRSMIWSKPLTIPPRDVAAGRIERRARPPCARARRLGEGHGAVEQASVDPRPLAEVEDRGSCCRRSCGPTRRLASARGEGAVRQALAEAQVAPQAPSQKSRHGRPRRAQRRTKRGDGVRCPVRAPRRARPRVCSGPPKLRIISGANSGSRSSRSKAVVTLEWTFRWMTTLRPVPTAPRGRPASSPCEAPLIRTGCAGLPTPRRPAPPALLERRRLARSDALDQRRDVVSERGRCERREHVSGSAPGPPLLSAGDVEAAGLRAAYAARASQGALADRSSRLDATRAACPFGV